MGSVSYTHLDVYKRQLQDSAVAQNYSNQIVVEFSKFGLTKQGDRLLRPFLVSEVKANDRP